MKESKFSFKKFITSVGFAIEGIKAGYIAGQNIIIMTVLAILALILAFVFKIERFEILTILVLIGIIIPLELINTAIEAAVDLHDGNKKSKYGKMAKDCAAGALTIASIIAAIIGLVIFVPYIIQLF